MSVEELNKLGTCSFESNEEEKTYLGTSAITSANVIAVEGWLHRKSLGCRDTNKIPYNYFKGKMKKKTSKHNLFFHVSDLYITLYVTICSNSSAC